MWMTSWWLGPQKKHAKQDTVALLTFLANNGHKASSKLQLVQTKITYLGHLITAAGYSLSKTPKTKKQVFPRNDVILQTVDP